MSDQKTPVENVLEAYKTAIVAAKIVANAQQLTQAVAQVEFFIKWQISSKLKRIPTENIYDILLVFNSLQLSTLCPVRNLPNSEDIQYF